MGEGEAEREGSEMHPERSGGGGGGTSPAGMKERTPLVRLVAEGKSPKQTNARSWKTREVTS